MYRTFQNWLIFLWKSLQTIEIAFLQRSISPDMLFSRVFVTSSPKFYYGNTDWYMELFRYGWPSVSGLSFGPENSPSPLSVATPPPPPEDSQAIQKIAYFELWFFNTCSEKQPSGPFLPGFGLAFAFVIKTRRSEKANCNPEYKKGKPFLLEKL